MKRTVFISILILTSFSGFCQYQISDTLLFTDSSKLEVTILRVDEMAGVIEYEFNGDLYYQSTVTIEAYYKDGKWVSPDKYRKIHELTYKPSWATRKDFTLYTDLTGLLNMSNSPVRIPYSRNTNSLITIQPQVHLKDQWYLQFSGLFRLKEPIEGKTYSFYSDGNYTYVDSGIYRYNHINYSRSFNIYWQCGVGPKYYFSDKDRSFYLGGLLYVGKGTYMATDSYDEDISYSYIFRDDILSSDPFVYFNADLLFGYEINFSEFVCLSFESYLSPAIKNRGKTPDRVYGKSSWNDPYKLYYESVYQFPHKVQWGGKILLGIRLN